MAGCRCGWLLTYTAALPEGSRYHAASTSTGFASDFRRTRRHPNQPRNFSALRRYVGRIRSSLQSRCQPINKFLLPAAFVQRTGKTTFAGLRSVRLRGKRSRLWCRRLGSNQRLSELALCATIRPSSTAEVRLHEGVPRHIPLWRRGGSLVLLWRWVTPFSRQPRRFSRCPIVGWTGRRASLPCYDTRTRTPTGGLEVSVGIGPTTCSLRMSCSAS